MRVKSDKFNHPPFRSFSRSPATSLTCGEICPCWAKWEVLLGIRLLGTTFWCGLSNLRAATAQMSAWQAEFSLRINKDCRVPTLLRSTSPFSDSSSKPRLGPKPHISLRLCRESGRRQAEQEHMLPWTWFCLLPSCLHAGIKTRGHVWHWTTHSQYVASSLVCYCLAVVFKPCITTLK